MTVALPESPGDAPSFLPCRVSSSPQQMLVAKSQPSAEPALLKAFEAVAEQARFKPAICWDCCVLLKQEGGSSSAAEPGPTSLSGALSSTAGVWLHEGKAGDNYTGPDTSCSFPRVQEKGQVPVEATGKGREHSCCSGCHPVHVPAVLLPHPHLLQDFQEKLQ